MQRSFFTRAMLAACVSTLLCLSSAVFAQIDPAKSKITTVLKQMGVPMTGQFKKFFGQIDYDPVDRKRRSAKLTVCMNSYDLGDETYNKEVAGTTWFNAKQHPQATFVASKIEPAPGKCTTCHNVTGVLKIKNKTQTVVVPVTVTEGANGARIFAGVLPIKRSAFDIGVGEWRDTSIVADEVQIKFHIVTAKPADNGSLPPPAC